MVRKHISRDFTNHIRTIEHIGDDDEYIKFEVFAYDPDYTKIFLPEAGTLTGENTTKTSWKSWSCFKSKDKINPMEFTVNYSALSGGDYQIDIVYEQNSNIYDDKDFNTHKDLTGWYDLYPSESKTEHKAVVFTDKLAKNAPKTVKKAYEKQKQKAISTANANNTDKANSAQNILFDGENNIIKRKTIFKHLNADNYKFEFGIPHNCYCMGVIIRKIKKFWGTNTDEVGSNLQFTNAKLTISDMAKPSELEVTVGFDDKFECETSPSGLYIDYMNECNLYVKNNEGNIVQVFGGYLTSALPDSDRTEISIHCADRLKDGEAKYILDQLLLQNGDGAESEYDTKNSISFDTYAQVLKYLCDICEITLTSNIDTNFLVEGEKFSLGKAITFGKKKDVKKVPINNAKVTINDKSITMRNNPSGKKKQVWTLYDAKKSAKSPTEITQYNNFHITYGLGNPKTEHKSKEVANVDIASSTAGSQKFGKCGQSQDKKYVMAIGRRSVGRGKATYNYSNLYRTIFENKCPHCGKATLRWDSARTDTKCIFTQNWNGTKRNWGGGIPETEITCNNCDSDYDSVTGWEKDGKYSSRLKKVGSTVKSSKAEQTKLHKGEMMAVVKNNASISSKDIFKAIKNSCKGYKHQTGTGSTATYLEKHEVGDCWAWSDKISKELKRYKVNHKIVQYTSGSSKQHRSVLYQNSKGNYVDFPYKEYNFPQGTWATSGSKKGKATFTYKKGGRINQAVVSGSTTKSQTTEVTTTLGYDKDAPIQGYFDICYSLEKSFSAKKYHAYVDFTQSAVSNYTMSGLTPVWVNNSSKKITLEKFIDKIKEYRGENARIYLQSIPFIAPKIETKTEEDSTNWYTYDKSTHDNSSCKMILYQLTFNNMKGVQPSDLQACGKTVNELMSSIVEETGYLVEMEYGEHRCFDKINFKVDDNTNPTFYAQEGNNNNILEWGSITYSPVNSLYNMSMCVYKYHDHKYHYTDTRVPESIMTYQEQCTLQTVNEEIGGQEAYWNARHSDKFNPEQTYTFTITVKGYPDVKLKNLVSVTANAKKLNTLKEVESISLTYDYKEKPVIQTELGLGELAPDIQVTKNIRTLRDNAKKSSTSFSTSATPVNSAEIYEWDN